MWSGALSRLSSRHVIVAAALLVVALTAVRVAIFWPRHTYVDTVSGVWIGMAADLADGIAYRPLVGPDGYGGTRYFPLHIAGHGGLISAGINPIWAGYAMSALAVGLVIAGLAMLLRRLGASTVLAMAAAALVLASQVFQQALLSVRPDALAAGLSLIGLAGCLGGRRRETMIGFVLFGLSIATKMTSVAGVLAAVVWLVVERRRREAIVGLVATAATVGVVIAIAAIASDGRFFDALRAGVGSGLSLRSLLRAPLTMMRIARETPETLIFLQLGAALWIVGLARGRVWSLPSIYWMASMLLAVPIFAAVGADINHLVEPAAASFLIAGAFAAADTDRLSVVAAVLVTGVLAGASSLAAGVVDARAEQRWGRLGETLRMIPDRTRPILSENAAVAVAAGQRPYILDPFIFRLIANRDPAFATPLREALERRAFAAVVIERDPHTDRGREWYGSSFFFDGFIETMERSYREAGRSRTRVIYLPR
jgi:hypothetical protein